MAEEGYRLQVVCGANEMVHVVPQGKTVREVRTILADILNIPEEAQALVSGDEVGNDHELCSGDVLEFVKRSGEKG